MSEYVGKQIKNNFPGIMETVKRVNGGEIPGQDRYACHLCIKKFTDQNKLDIHLGFMHGITHIVSR